MRQLQTTHRTPFRQRMNRRTKHIELMRGHTRLILLLALATLSSAGTCSALPFSPQPAQDETARLTFPGEYDLATLVDYVSQRLEIRIIYDSALANKKITIRAPGDVPVESLSGVLQSALRINGLALVDTGDEGWKKIVDVGRMSEAAREVDAESAIAKSGSETPVTQVFMLEHADPTQLEQSIRPFLSQSQTATNSSANLLAIKDQRMLIVTDYASNILRLEKLIKLIDQPRESTITRFIPARELDAESLAEKVTKLLVARQRSAGKSADAGSGVEVTFDARTNQVIVLGEKTNVEQVERYLETFDVPVDVRTEVYPLRDVSAERAEVLIRGLIEVRESKPIFKVIVDKDQNVLVIATTEELHKEIAELLKKLAGDPQSRNRNTPVRFHKLKYATAEEMLRTIRDLEGSVTKGRDQRSDSRTTDGQFQLQPDQNAAGVSRPDTQLPAGVLDRALQLPPGALNGNSTGSTDAAGTVAEVFRDEQSVLTPSGTGQLTITEAIGKARITADEAANMLIVVATPEVHQVYKELIDQLDRPRPQVLIEAKLVILDTSDDFTLGVEVSGGDRTGAKKLFAFSSYGFSEVNRTNGALSILPGLGFNGTLVNPQVADVVLRAVTNHRRSKVISSPRILVNDHATGHLTSVTEVPFNSFNTFNTVSSTSFAGYAQAGTTITVTPHISEGEQLNLEYTITLNAFQASGGSSSGPPPRQTDSLESIVTIPDGFTIIVGGLNRSNHAVTLDSIPFLEQIPILQHLLSKTTSQQSGTSLFVFLRPVILRDDKFRELKYVSERDTKRANVPGTFPVSRSLLVK